MFTRILRKSPVALLTLATTFLATSDAKAQLAANTYQFSAFSTTYADIVGGTAISGVLVDDGTSAAINIGFTFNYCGTDYTQVKACSNGWITFNTAVTSATWTNSQTDLTTIKPALMPLFDDLAGWGTGAAASYVLTGTAPNRVFTVEFKNWNWRGSSGNPPNISFQVKLYETSNVVQYVYRQETAAGNPGGATIGIGDNAGTAGYLVLNNASASPTASSTSFTTNIVAKPATGQVYQFKPLPAFDMSADSILVDANFCSNASQPASVAISNKGTATISALEIQWSVDGVAQPAVTYSGSPISNVTTAPNNTATVLLGDVFYPNTTPRVIKAWVTQPNGQPDAVNTNDTVTQSKVPTLTGVVAHISPQDTTICSGSTITLDAGSYPKDPIYIWNNSQVGQTISVSQPGSYMVKVQNTDGCFDYDTIQVSVHPSPLINSIAIIDNGSGSYTFNAIGAQNITGYTWDFGDNSQPFSGTGTPGQQLHTYTTAGDYIVTLTLWNDCGEIESTKLISTPGNAPAGIDELEALQRQISVFPNPARSVVTISNDAGITIESVTVFNILGQKVTSLSKIKATHTELNVAGLTAGLYNVTIETARGKITRKLEITK